MKLMLCGYTYFKTSGNHKHDYWTCTAKFCKASAKTNKENAVIWTKGFHQHGLPNFSKTKHGDRSKEKPRAVIERVDDGLKGIIIPSQTKRRCNKLMYHGYTYFHVNAIKNQHYWKCCSFGRGCKATAKTNGENVVIWTKDTHQHDPPNFSEAKNGDRYKAKPKAVKERVEDRFKGILIPPGQTKRRYNLLMYRGYTYFQGRVTKNYVYWKCCSYHKDCKASAKTNGENVVIWTKGTHQHDPPDLSKAKNGNRSKEKPKAVKERVEDRMKGILIPPGQTKRRYNKLMYRGYTYFYVYVTKKYVYWRCCSFGRGCKATAKTNGENVVIGGNRLHSHKPLNYVKTKTVCNSEESPTGVQEFSESKTVCNSEERPKDVKEFSENKTLCNSEERPKGVKECSESKTVCNAEERPKGVKECSESKTVCNAKERPKGVKECSESKTVCNSEERPKGVKERLEEMFRDDD